LAHGAGRVVIDGAIDRRAASSPDVSDGLVMSTGAILSEDLGEVVARTAEAPAIAELLGGAVNARRMFVAGALPQRFLDGLVPAVRRARRELTVAVSDPTRLFLTDRSVAHYARAGIELRVLKPIDLIALSVNPVAPQSHTFDSAR